LFSAVLALVGGARMGEKQVLRFAQDDKSFFKNANLARLVRWMRQMRGRVGRIVVGVHPNTGGRAAGEGNRCELD
jgi:hypothetical protein